MQNLPLSTKEYLPWITRSCQVLCLRLMTSLALVHCFPSSGYFFLEHVKTIPTTGCCTSSFLSLSIQGVTQDIPTLESSSLKTLPKVVVSCHLSLSHILFYFRHRHPYPFKWSGLIYFHVYCLSLLQAPTYSWLPKLCWCFSLLYFQNSKECLLGGECSVKVCLMNTNVISNNSQILQSLMCIRYWCNPYMNDLSQKTSELEMILNPHATDETQSLRESEGHAGSRSVCGHQRQDLNPGSVNDKLTLLH